MSITSDGRKSSPYINEGYYLNYILRSHQIPTKYVLVLTSALLLLPTPT